MGRPTNYNDEIAAIICERIANGESVRTICADDEMPAQATIYKWLNAHPGFVEQYARAREMQADKMAEEILQIADDGSNDTYVTDSGEAVNHDVIARSRLRVDARKWLAAKMAPKKYGDKVETTLKGDAENPLVSRYEVVIVDPED